MSSLRALYLTVSIKLNQSKVFWHSSAHVLGSALEGVFGSHLTIGPPLQSGFYYDCYMGEHVIADDSLKKVEDKAAEICKAKHAFQRLKVVKEQALEMFKHNPFKVITLTWSTTTTL